MLKQSFGGVTIETVDVPKRGLCMQATAVNGEKIYMDYCGMNPALVPDGINAYFFGNKLIVVARWSDLDYSQREQIENSRMTLLIHPYKCPQLSLKINGIWNNVRVELYHCYEQLNDENAPVDEVLFVLADTHDANYLVVRPIVLPSHIGIDLQKLNCSSHAELALDGSVDIIRQSAQDDPHRDFCDILYRMNRNLAADYNATAKMQVLDSLSGGIYIEIEPNNWVSDFYKTEGELPELIPALELEPEPVYEPEPEPVYVPEPEPVPDFDVEVAPGTEYDQNLAVEVQGYIQRAMQNDPVAQNCLGECYELGSGIVADIQQAVYWYSRACEQSYAPAQTNLGLCYLMGKGIQPDHSAAINLFYTAALQNYAEAQYQLGSCYMLGYGTGIDKQQAVYWYGKAAEQNHIESQYNLAVCYMNGDGVPVDYQAAVSYLYAAAIQGDAYAQYSLAWCYFNGYGVTVDKQQAIYWYGKAAEQSVPEAQRCLGSCYYFGDGVALNYETAAGYFYAAALQGDMEAQYNLGICYYNGHGVQQDLNAATEWIRMSAEQGYEAAIKLM